MPGDAASSGAGEVLLVTGGGGGIGEAVALRMAASGWRVAVADRDEGAARRVAERVGGLALSINVVDEDSVEVALETLHARFGRLDGLVHAAGIGLEAGFLQTSREDFARVLDVNLTGTLLVCQAAARRMASGGRLVTIASTAGELGSMRRAAYGASKAGVIALTKTMAAELAPSGLRANVLSPGPVRTALVDRMHGPATKAAFGARVPLGRYAEPKEIAEAAAYLLSPANTYMTGHVLTVDGGFTAVPTIIAGD